MYSKSFPFKDFNGKPHNTMVHFNLTEPDVFKLLVELKAIFAWHDSLQGEPRELEAAEVVEFYTNFEEVLLAAYGTPSADGLSFKKGDRYAFQETALFAAIMVAFVSDPPETMKFLTEIMPKGLPELVKKADENLAVAMKDADTPEAVRAQIAELQAKLKDESPDQT